MVKSTCLIPHQTALWRKSVIKFLFLFDQVGQLRTNTYLQQWPATCARKVNRSAVEQRGATTFQVIRFNTKQSASALPSNVPPSFATITLRTQVKNNLRWLLRGFALKYWAILIKLSASHLQEIIWHLKRRGGSNRTFLLPASAAFSVGFLEEILLKVMCKAWKATLRYDNHIKWGWWCTRCVFCGARSRRERSTMAHFITFRSITESHINSPTRPPQIPMSRVCVCVPSRLWREVSQLIGLKSSSR